MTARIHDYPDAQVASRPEALALRDSTGAALSYADLQSVSSSLADRFVREGVAAGDRVLIVTENCAAAVAAIFACSRIGAVAVPVNARQTAAEIDRILDHGQPRLMLFSSDVSAEAQAHANRLDAVPLDHGLRCATPYASAPDVEEDVAVMLYTTGTTGAPKGVMLTHANLRFAGNASAELRGMTGSDLIYGALPITHVFGLASMVMAASRAGAALWLAPRFSAAELYDALGQGVTVVPAVPQMHAMLMDHARANGLQRLGHGTLRYVSSGAAPLDPEWKRQAETFYGVALQNGYGMTESTAGISATRNAKGDPDTSVGHPLDGVEVRIIDADKDGVGEVCTRGPHVMRGYYQSPDETAKTIDGEGWLHTGDLGRMDARGCLHILGRRKELIIHGGFNVYPPEVEAALNDHPAVVQSAVIGWIREGGEEDVVAFVQPTEPTAVTEAALKAHVADRLAGYKRPVRIIISSTLPSAPTGKVLKHKLLSAFEGELRSSAQRPFP